MILPCFLGYLLSDSPAFGRKTATIALHFEVFRLKSRFFQRNPRNSFGKCHLKRSFSRKTVKISIIAIGKKPDSRLTCIKVEFLWSQALKPRLSPYFHRFLRKFPLKSEAIGQISRQSLDFLPPSTKKPKEINIFLNFQGKKLNFYQFLGKTRDFLTILVSF